MGEDPSDKSMREGTLDLTGQLSWYFLYGMKLTATRDQSIEKINCHIN